MENAVEVRGLKKAYKDVTAVDGIDLTVSEGEIFGLIGHNGAGKTTTIECILGTRTRDSGEVSVLGMDPVRDRKKLFTRTGVQFQHTSYQNRLRIGEACEVTASLYPGSCGSGKWKELLEQFGLSGRTRKEINELSGGEKQKLSVVLALIPGPDILFLDELTTGLDPAARRGIWGYLKELRESGVTIILTSHYMDEVEYLCDRIAIMKKGLITAQGAPHQLMEINGTKNLEDLFMLYGEEKKGAVKPQGYVNASPLLSLSAEFLSWLACLRAAGEKENSI